MTTKRIYNAVFTLLAMLMAASCADYIEPAGPDTADGEKVSVSIGIDVPTATLATPTRAMGEIDDDGRKALAVRLYVFDADGFLVETVDVGDERTNVDTYESAKRNETQFKVELTKSTRERRIHFVAVRLPEGKKFDDVITVGNPYGTEVSVMSSISVGDNQDAYWQRVVLPDGIPAPTAPATTIEIPALQRVPLIRNFAKFTVKNEATSNFSLDGFVVMNCPERGTVAPYNTSTAAFEPFFVDESGKIYNNKTYKQIDATGYDGFLTSSDVERLNTNAKELKPADFTSAAKYMYESPNSESPLRGKTYILIKGTYTENGTAKTNRYYKIDIIYADETTKTTYFYNILRNFEYAVRITGVSFEGYDSPEAAASRPASNNISAAVEAQGVNNIADAHNRIFVNNLYFAFTSGGKKENKVLFKYRHASQDNWQNYKVHYTILEGADIFTTDGMPVLNAGSQTTPEYVDATNGWSGMTFTLEEPTSTPQTATLRIYSTDGSDNTLSRDVTILLHQPYEMRVDCPEMVREATGTSMQVNLLLPDGINDGLFPLTFYLEPMKKTLYPDPMKEVELPVHIGQTIVGSDTYNSFQYSRNVKAEEYDNAETRVVEGKTYRVIPCYFKTSVAESATTVYAANEYFKTAFDNFSNGTQVFRTGATVDITPTEYYGAGNTFITFSFETTDAAVISYTVTEGGQTMTVTNVEVTSAGTHTIKVPTQTFDSSDYTVRITGHYKGETATQAIQGSYNSTFKWVASTDANGQEVWSSEKGAYPIHRHLLHLPHLAFETNIGTGSFDSREYIRVYRNSTVNCGRVYIQANGIWGDAGDREHHAFYNIDTDYNRTALEASTEIRFVQEGDNHKGATASITAGDITQLQKVDVEAGVTDLHLLSEEEATTKEADAPAGGLYKKTLTFSGGVGQ